MLENLPGAARGRVLVIDDDAGVRRLVCAVLQRSGFAVLEADDGVDGVEQYRIHGPDLAFVDIEMPRKDGLQVIREIRASFPHARLISMSGASTSNGVDVAQAAREAGALAFMPKPITVDGLLATVDVGLCASPGVDNKAIQ